MSQYLVDDRLILLTWHEHAAHGNASCVALKPEIFYCRFNKYKRSPWRHLDTVFAVEREYAVTNSSGTNLHRFSWPTQQASKPGQVHSRFRHQGSQPGNEIQQFEDDMRGAIAVGRFKLIPDIP